ncbi:MAG: hypothetical protein AAF799_12150 [Myxococcota bacterium]
MLGSLVVGMMLAGCRASAGPSVVEEPEPSPVGQVDSAPAESALAPADAPKAPEIAASDVEAEVLAPAEAEAEVSPAEVLAEAPEPFEGRDRVRVRELIEQLDAIATDMAELPTVRADYEALLEAKGLSDSEALYRDYVRVKLAFEATRDGGFWHLHWDITNEKPNSDQIWKQWRRAEGSDDDAPVPTATAECDELSALFAFVARKLGVRHIGLFWPQWNHVVAVWTVQSEEGSPVRIVVPTSPIFLEPDESLGTDGFDPWTQKTIFEYRRRDVKDDHRIDAELARFFVVQARRHGGRSQVELQRLRNARDLAMNARES